MIAWDSEHLPIKNLYDVQVSYEDNAMISRYDSGRVISWRRNTSVKRRYAVTYWATAEQARFFDHWYRSILGGNGMVFTAPSLEGTGKTVTYRMANTPTIEGQAFKDISMEWQEV